MSRHIMLLRGVNVSGANIVKMADLRAFLAGLGFESVETHIQSGNAVFSSKQSAAESRGSISEAFPGRFGFAPKMMLLSAREFSAAIEGNPFKDSGIDPAKLHLGFMAEPPGEAALAALAERARGSEEYAVSGAALYLVTPDGLGTSKFAPVIEKTLKTPVTFRNWRTVLALEQMAARSAG